MVENGNGSEGRSVSLPRAYWNIIDTIQSARPGATTSGILCDILERFFAENNYLEEHLGPEKAAVARKFLRIQDIEVRLERKR